MKKRIVIAVVAILLLLVSFNLAMTEDITLITESDGTITLDGHSYVPINLWNKRPADNVKLILTALYTFEKKHPEFKIIHWHIEKQQVAINAMNEIYGLWVDHELREPDLKKEKENK